LAGIRCQRTSIRTGHDALTPGFEPHGLHVMMAKTEKDGIRTSPPLTVGQETYIETIGRLCAEHGHAHTKAIAEALDVRMPTVTQALSLLAQKGYIHYEARKAITLTRTGQKFADELHRRHDLLNDFYYDILGLPKWKADEIACRVEHVIDREFADHLTDFYRFLTEELSSDSVKQVREFKNRYR
jgi:DtxR family Mn-dependent transcriptional regulator